MTITSSGCLCQISVPEYAFIASLLPSARVKTRSPNRGSPNLHIALVGSAMSPVNPVSNEASRGHMRSLLSIIPQGTSTALPPVTLPLIIERHLQARPCVRRRIADPYRPGQGIGTAVQQAYTGVCVSLVNLIIAACKCRLLRTCPFRAGPPDAVFALCIWLPRVILLRAASLFFHASRFV